MNYNSSRIKLKIVLLQKQRLKKKPHNFILIIYFCAHENNPILRNKEHLYAAIVMEIIVNCGNVMYIHLLGKV